MKKIIWLLLIFTCCKPVQVISHDTTSKDSTVISVKPKTITVSEPADSTEIFIAPFDSSLKHPGFTYWKSTTKPDGTLAIAQKFTFKNRQSSGEVDVLKNGELEVISRCDSLAKQVTVLDSVVKFYQTQTINNTIVQKVKNPLNEWLAIGLIICLALIAVLLLIIKIKR